MDDRLGIIEPKMKEITDALVTPDLIATLKDEARERKFWREVDLKTLVQWRM